MVTDRNLLFGVLALQADLLTSAQFAEACSAWAGRKETPLAELLVKRGWLTPGDLADVEKLLQRKLAKHRGDARASLAELTTDPVRQSLAGLNDPDIRQSLTGPTPPPQGHVLVATTAYVPEVCERYTLSRLHATGGIGRVWLARDASLGRDVALKELRPERAGQPTVWSRFFKEAQVTGQLEHPGIVPVYEVGRRPDDQAPFYTMRFVRGRTLAEAARTYHERRARGEAGPLELRELLSSFLGVCNAVAYAHSRGVLHRDLKPQNVVLGDYGEAIVLDWGLAKVMGEPEGADAADRAPVALAGEGSRDDTVAGQVLGTPAYMAPEQAEGRLDLLDARTDVYGLGAILYEVLTSKSPFAGEQTERVLQRVIHELPEPPRHSVPQTPRPLQAICLKALAKKPADRYGSAKDIAAEVQHWLADEPVAAYREPIPTRAARWARRHRTLTAVAAVLLVVGAAGLGVSTLLVNRQRARAEENARQAREAVDDMYTQVAEKWLSQEPQLEDVQREFLEKALRFYERLAASEDSSPEIRREAGRAARRAGEIQRKLGDSGAAERSFLRSTAILGALTDDVGRAELANTHNSYAWFLWTVGKRPDEEIQRALEVGEEIAARRPDILLARDVVSGAHSRLGIIQSARGQLAEAVASHLLALEPRAALAHENPDKRDHRAGEARTRSNLVTVYRQAGRLRDADIESARAVEIVAALVAERPRNPTYRADLVHNLDERANLLSLLGRHDEAEAHLRQASELVDRLVADFPSSVEHRDLASAIRRDLAVLRRDQGKSREAEPDLRRVIAAAEALIQQYPDVPNYRRSLAVHCSNLGDLLHTAGRPPVEPKAEYEKALAIAEDLVKKQPDVVDYRSLRALYRSSLAFLLRVTGEFTEAAVAYDQVIAEFDALTREFPTMPHFKASLASACYQAGETRSLLKPPGDPERYLERALRTAEPLADEFDFVPSYHVTAAQSLVTLAQFALDRSALEQARAFLERAGRHVAPALKADAHSNAHRFLKLRTLAIMAQVQARSGDLKGSDVTSREIDAMPTTGIEHYNAACFIALAVAAVQDSKAPAAERDALVKSSSDLAVAQLSRAIAAGYRNVNLMRTDPDLAAIRSREDFQKLVEQVEKEFKEKAKGGGK